MKFSPQNTLTSRHTSNHGGVVRSLAHYPHLGGEAMGRSVLHQAAVNAVRGAGSATADVRRVDVEDVQAFDIAVRMASAAD